MQQNTSEVLRSLHGKWTVKDFCGLITSQDSIVYFQEVNVVFC